MRDTDAECLRRAAKIVRQNSKRPASILLDAFCRMLLNLADKLDRTGGWPR